MLTLAVQAEQGSLGEITFGGLRSGLGSASAFGDGVNIAARLEGIAEPGGISISEDAWRQVQGKVTANFVDAGVQNLKNIPRPVRVYRLELEEERAAPPAAWPTPSPEHPSIAVLPFQNMSGDPEQEHFCDGLVEDIITTLSKLAGLRVIARNSSFVYKRVVRLTCVKRPSSWVSVTFLKAVFERAAIAFASPLS